MKNIQRSFFPGSNWVYIKLYSGSRIADEVLIQVVVPIIKELIRKKHIEKWFFIRYTDPFAHLRIRLLVSNPAYIYEVISMFHKKTGRWTKDGLLWKIQLDTYNRELERYGSLLIEESESLFHIDSDCILSIISKLKNREQYRWMAALKLIDDYLSDFSFSIEDKLQIMKKLSYMFKLEFGFNEYNSKQFNIEYRKNRPNIELVLNSVINDNDFNSIISATNKRSKEMKIIVKQINTKLKSSGIKIEELLMSYLHMTLNRLFRTKNRIHELVLYDFMRRYYTSEMAKQHKFMTK